MTGTTTPAADAALDVLLLPVGAELHALALSSVREVVPYADVTQVPDAPVWLDGLVNIRGDVLPAVGTAVAFGVTGDHAPSHLVIADTRRGRVAVMASDTPTPSRLGDRAGAGEHPGAAARHLAGDSVCTLLDLDALTATP